MTPFPPVKGTLDRLHKNVEGFEGTLVTVGDRGTWKWSHCEPFQAPSSTCDCGLFEGFRSSQALQSSTGTFI